MEDLSVTAAIQSYGTPNMAEPTLIDDAMYRAMYEASIRDPETFWGEHGKRIDWIRPYSRVKNCSFAHPDVSIKWFEDGTLNVSANCIDRHLKGTKPANSTSRRSGRLEDVVPERVVQIVVAPMWPRRGRRSQNPQKVGSPGRTRTSDPAVNRRCPL